MSSTSLRTTPGAILRCAAGGLLLLAAVATASAHPGGHGPFGEPAGEPPASAETPTTPTAKPTPVRRVPGVVVDDKKRPEGPPLLAGIEAPIRALAADVAKALKDANLDAAIVLDKAAFKPHLDAFQAKAGPHDKVHITGFEVRATLWFGIVPVRDFDLFFWLAEDRIKLLRYTLPPRSEDMFRRSSDPVWAGPQSAAFMQAIERVVEASQTGRCWQLDVVKKGDLAAVLPEAKASRRRAIASLMRHAFSVRPHCEELSKVPFNRVTFRFGPAGGVLLGEGAPQSFRFGLEMGSDGDPRLAHLNPPVAPGIKRKPRLPKRVKKPAAGLKKTSLPAKSSGASPDKPASVDGGSAPAAPKTKAQPKPATE